MNKKFAASALSLAIAAAVQPTPVMAENCVDKGRDGTSVNEWGVWCGVDKYLNDLSSQAPTAAGAEGGESFASDVSNIARDSKQFDHVPDANTDHIALPVVAEDEYVGYFARYDLKQTYTYDYETGYGNAVTEVRDADVGGFALALEDNDGGYGAPTLLSQTPDVPDKVAYVMFSPNGTAIEGHVYNENASGYAGDVYYQKYAVVNVDPGVETTVFFQGDDETRQNGYGSAVYSGHAVFGYTPTAYFSEADEDHVLESYFAGRAFNGIETDAYSGSTYSDTMDGKLTTFVAGQLTPAAVIQDLISGNVQADYRGATSFLMQDVAINVDFGHKTFTADFSDASAQFHSQNGIPGDENLGFTAAGNINGRNLVSSSITAYEGTMTGVMQASFFQPDASVIGGVYDVHKGAHEIVDTFTAVKGADSEVYTDK